MAATEKYGEAYDAEYVDRMVGKVLVQACSAVTLNRPHDPIEYLSLWLHKYCDNTIILQDYEREKQHKIHKEIKAKEDLMKKNAIIQELINQQNSTLNYMRSITNDPYLLWDTCLRAINTYTGCQSAYVAVVIRKIFEPKPKKKKKVEGEGEEEEEEEEVVEEPEEGEEGEGKDEGSDVTSLDEEPPEADEEKPEGEEGEGEPEPPPEEEEEEPAEAAEGEEGEEGEEEEPPPPKPFRIPKPLNYKNRRILYVSATLPSHIHMLNRQIVIKQGPVTFSLLIEGLQELHIPNVLYKKGIHYFGGCPRVGAYFVAPMSVEYIAKKYLAKEFKERPVEMFEIVKQKQVLALLCCDTLKSDNMGNGRPFQQIELDFIQSCANTMSTILDENNKEITKDHNTPEVIQKFKDQLREVKLARVEQMEQEKELATRRTKAKDKLKRLKKFQELHKAWEERQAVKAKAKAKEERQKEKERKKKEDAGEEVPEEEPAAEEPAEGEEAEDDDPEPVLEPDPEEEPPAEGEEEAEELPPPEPEADEEGEEKEVEDEFKDEELEPNPMAEIEGEGGEGGEGEEGEAAAEEEPEEEEEAEEPEEPEEPEEEAAPEEGGEEVVEKPKESEEMIKLKERKKAHAKKEKEMKKAIKELTKLVKGFEKRRKKAIAALEKLTPDIEKYERALFVANGVVQYLKKHMENAYNLLVENKVPELDRIRRWPYPNRHVQRILKALLHLLGHKKIVVDDWVSARKLFNPNLLDKVLKDYDPVVTNDPERWEDVDSYLLGLKDEKLPEQACVGFLLQQWILACKKTTAAGEKYLTIKAKYEEMQKDYATLEMEKIVCEAETQISDTKLKKMVDVEEMRVEKEVDEIEAEEKRLADLAAEEAAKKEEEDKMYAEVAAQQEIEAAEAAALAAEEAAAEGAEEGA